MWLKRLSVASALVVAITIPAAANDVVVWEILDMACFISRGERGRGPAHVGCAQACAKKGMPLGVITDQPQVYLLYPEHGLEKTFDRVKELAGQRAKLTGTVSEHDGMKGFEVHDVEAAD